MVALLWPFLAASCTAHGCRPVNGWRAAARRGLYYEDQKPEALRRAQDGARPMSEQTAQIYIAPFRDRAQLASRPTRVFARRESQPARKLSGATEGGDPADGPDEGRRG